MRLGVLWTIAVAVALTAGCTTLPIATPFASREPHDFFPLRQGNFWVYEVRDADGRAAIERVLVRGTVPWKTREIEAVVVEESGGMSGEFDLDVSWHPVVYYRRGLFLYKFSSVSFVGGELHEVSVGEGEEKVLPENPVEQPEWQSDFDIFRESAGADYSARMVSIATPADGVVKVRAGTFRNCLRVDTQSVLTSQVPHAPASRLSFHYVDWYAPGVGLVKSEVHASGHVLPVTTVELLSFRDGNHPD